MTIPSEHCEAKLHALRRSDKGVVVSFTLHPQELPECVMTDPLGTRYMLALVRIGDDEQPAPSPAKPPKPKRHFHELPASAQAGIACADVAFQQWLDVISEEEAAAKLRRTLDIKSRAELDTPGPAQTAWQNMYPAFLQWAGRVPVQR